MKEITQVPRKTTKEAVQWLEALRGRQTLSETEANEILDWLSETEVEPLRCWVGELAAHLLRDHAGPGVKRRAWNLIKEADDWKLYFYLIALMNERNRPRLKVYLKKASSSEETVIRSFAEHVLWNQKQ